MKLSIPEMPREEIDRWAARIVPLIWVPGPIPFRQRAGRLAVAVHHADAVDQSYLWDAKPGANPPRDLAVLTRINTLHTYGYHGMFKPSVGEVVRQIPKDYLPLTTHFLVNGPEDAHDLNLQKDALVAGFHRARTTLYVVGNPIEIVADAAYLRARAENEKERTP